MNQKVFLLSDQHNPSVKFNISKYYEFKYGTELFKIKTRDLKKIEAHIAAEIHELDIKAY